MKKINDVLLTLSLIAILPTYAQQPKTCLSILSNFIYSIRMCLGRSDYAFLASQDEYGSLLKEKIARKDDIEDLDRYSIAGVYVLNQTHIPVYYTPLQEAVIHSNLEAVKELCKAGADKNKAPKTHVREQEVAQDTRLLGFLRSWREVEPDKLAAEIEATKQRMYIGVTALKLAKKVMQKKDDYADAQTIKARQEIYKYLSKK